MELFGSNGHPGDARRPCRRVLEAVVIEGFGMRNSSAVVAVLAAMAGCTPARTEQQAGYGGGEDSVGRGG